MNPAYIIDTDWIIDHFNGIDAVTHNGERASRLLAPAQNRLVIALASPAWRRPTGRTGSACLDC